jgi:hypothetical protein
MDYQLQRLSLLKYFTFGALLLVPPAVKSASPDFRRPRIQVRFEILPNSHGCGSLCECIKNGNKSIQS